ncbi:MAG: hypothetical protein CMI02_00040 [Oceanospirillaceae bacterium]|nr:hypothetical protein [Oceanospirillaceae bacterium]MBT10406.1 hypothetical protein [Oceanospirillaceae bacterium]|tara:strand:- start:17651 stop:18043 length:393 start_codon:yes stop_codon:yes gene_type:complete
MARHYMVLLRTFWLGGLWASVYLVRPLLEHRGFFPQHGIEVLHVMNGLGLVSGALILFLARLAQPLHWRETPLQIMLVMMALALMYFALMPWWKLQMMVLHTISLLGLIWLMMAPGLVLVRERRRDQRSR